MTLIFMWIVLFCNSIDLIWGARDFNVEFAYKPHIMKGHKSHY